MLTIEALRAYSPTADEGLARCLNNEAFYLRMVSMMKNDTHASDLLTAVRQNDMQAAFEAAHALKGSLANLALQPALDAVTKILEPLRRRDHREDYEEMALHVCQEMDRIQEMIG